MAAGGRGKQAGMHRRSACSVAVGSGLRTLKLSPRWAGGCGATACVSVLQGEPKRGGWCGDATSGLLGRRSALFKHALHAVIVRRVAGAQWGERGASMGYGLWALRLCGREARAGHTVGLSGSRNVSASVPKRKQHLSGMLLAGPGAHSGGGEDSGQPSRGKGGPLETSHQPHCTRP